MNSDELIAKPAVNSLIRGIDYFMFRFYSLFLLKLKRLVRKLLEMVPTPNLMPLNLNLTDMSI